MAVMDNPESGLEELVVALRTNAADDLAFAQRVALVCCTLIEQKADPLAAIRTVFRLP